MESKLKKPYIPDNLPPKIDYSPFIRKIAEAREKVVRYDEAVKRLPNPEIVQKTLGTQEAVLSSQIEGTQVTLDEVFLFDAKEEKKEDTPKERDYREVINYRIAISYGKQILEKKPLSENVIKELHKILLQSVRGKNKNPGEFRKTQVYIARPGASIEQASFIPAPPQEIPRLFSDLEKFIHYNTEIDEIVKAGIVHFQFEAIHPFLDGNGRIGRLLVPLILYEKKITSYPNVYISEYFEANKREYYNRLNAVSENGDWAGWINFFLDAVIEQTQEAYEKVNKIEKLYNYLQKEARDFNSIYAHDFIDAIFMMPRFQAKSIQQIAKIKNTQTVYNLIEKFLQKQIIKDTTRDKERNKIYAFNELLSIIR